MRKYKVIGLMSGTSLDGLDIACCDFSLVAAGWQYKIEKAETLDYPDNRKALFQEMYTCTGQRLIELDHEYGRFLGNAVNQFCRKHQLTSDLIASHGHTIFHQPENGFTFQAGNGADLHASTGIPVVCDFRSLDVASGGQGAPLVPIGDKLLFGQYAMCLNLGGIANISFSKNDERLAYDICPVNIVLNELSLKLGHAYDAEGSLAASGSVANDLIEKLNSLEYYSANFPKSIGKEWIDLEVLPIIDTDLPVRDLLATFCKHISIQINKAVSQNKGNVKPGATINVLVTGGGAFNTHLIQLLQKDADEGIRYVTPENEIVMFKEALIFAFLGLLRIINQPNALAAVTGAKKNTSGGALFGDFSKFKD